MGQRGYSAGRLSWWRQRAVAGVAVVGLLGWACVRNPPPVEPDPPTPPPQTETVRRPAPSSPASPRPAVREEPPPPPSPPPVVPEDEFASRSLEEINSTSPLEPVFFAYDSAALDGDAMAAIRANVDVLERYPTWNVTIEGHCDERGTPEYNLGLGERRALAVHDYLISLGLSPARIRTVSYGKEFPFDPGHAPDAWASNRRAHFVVTSR